MAEINLFDKVGDGNFWSEIARLEAVIKGMDSISTVASKSGGGRSGSGKSNEAAEFDAMKKAVEELIAARKRLTVAEQYDYKEVTKLRMERTKLIDQYKQEILALDGKSKAQIKAAKDAETAAKLEAKAQQKAQADAEKRYAAEQKAMEKKIIAQQKADAAQQKADAKAQQEALKKTGFINNLQSEVDQLRMAYYRLSETELKSFTGQQMQADLQSKAAMVNKLKQGTGDFSKNVGNYSSATKMLGINLGQVMKELPNFAISARTGIMSLTNNLPMLAEAVQAVRLEQIAARKAQEGLTAAQIASLPNGGKIDGMFKMLTRSIFGLTGVVSLLMVLFQVFGADIIEMLIPKMSAAEKATKDFMDALKSNSTEMTSTMKNLSDMTVLLGNIDSKYITSKEVLDKYNSTLGQTFGAAKNVAEAEQLLVDKGGAYIDIMLRIAAANFLQANAIENVSQAEQLKRDKDVKWYQRILPVLKVFGSNESVFGGGMLNPKIMKKMIYAGSDESILGGRQKESEKKMTDAKSLMKQFYDDMDKIHKDAASKGIDLNGNKIDNGGSGGKGGKSMKKGSEMFVTRDEYAGERIKVQKEIAKNEIDIMKETEDRELNSFEKRIQAAKDFFANSQYLAALERVEADTNLLHKYENDKKELEDKRKTNNDLFEQNLMTKERHTELEKQYIDAIETLEANYNDDKIKTEYDESVKIEALRKKHLTTILAIQSDFYKMEAEANAQNTKQRLAAIDIEYEQVKAAIEKTGILEAMGSVIGFNKNNSVKMMQAKQNNTKSKFAAKYGENLKNIESNNISDDEKSKLEAENTTLSEQFKSDTNRNQLEIQKEIEKQKSELMVETLSATLDMMSELWDNYWEQQKEKTQKIENEKFADIEDREKAGVITAKQAEEEKARNKDYFDSVYKEQERKKFLVEQGLALAKIIMNTAIGAVNYGSNPLTAALVPWIIALGAVQAGVVAAQTIPAFAEGTEFAPGGKSILGDGGRRELVIDPSGNFFVTEDTPTLYDLKRGSKVFPDAQKADISSYLAMKQVGVGGSNDRLLLNELRNVTKAVNNQKKGNFYGMPLIQQLQNKDKYAARRRSLMN